jgi:hypothetical protein
MKEGALFGAQDTLQGTKRFAPPPVIASFDSPREESASAHSLHCTVEVIDKSDIVKAAEVTIPPPLCADFREVLSVHLKATVGIDKSVKRILDELVLQVQPKMYF